MYWDSCGSTMWLWRERVELLEPLSKHWLKVWGVDTNWESSAQAGGAPKHQRKNRATQSRTASVITAGWTWALDLSSSSPTTPSLLRAREWCEATRERKLGKKIVEVRSKHASDSRGWLNQRYYQQSSSLWLLAKLLGVQQQEFLPLQSQPKLYTWRRRNHWLREYPLRQ